MRSYLIMLIVFTKTLAYLAWSFVRPSQVEILKQSWAVSFMKTLGFEISFKGQAPVLQGRAMILVGNHFSFLDIPMLMAASQGIVFIAKKEVRSWPIIGFGAFRIKTIFVERENKENRSEVRKHIAQELQTSKTKLVVFPSGTTTLTENLTWKKGIFEIAEQAHIPVKAFHLRYSPWRECAYIDDDSLLGQMKKILNMKNKTAVLTWLDEYQITKPIEAAEEIRQQVVVTDQAYEAELSQF